MEEPKKEQDIEATSDTVAENVLKDLKVVVIPGQSWTRFLEIEVPAETVTTEFESTYDDYRKKAKIPGFRPGKAPIGIVKRRYADNVKIDVMENIVPKAYEQALEQESLIPLAPPKLTNIDFEEGKPLKFKAEIEIRPQVTLNKYTGFRVEKRIDQIGEKEIDESLEYLREKMAEFFPVQRAAENGDLVIVDLLKKHDKLGRLKEEKLENVEIELGHKGILEEFQRGILGLKIGEMKDISVKYPDNYYDKNLAGDQILYLAVVKEIKKKSLPELNDEFAARVSEAKTVAELREKAKESLQHEAQDNATRRLRNEIIKRVIDANQFDAPISLLNSYLDGIIEDFKKKGESFDEAEVRTRYRPLGENMIRWSYLYYEIAKAENVKVEAEDRKKWVENFARTYNLTPEAAREALGKSQKLQDIDDSILEEKVLQLIIDKSEIITN